MKDYTVHWAAEVFPLLHESSKEFNELAGSILEKGVLQPIVVDGDVLLDGRNRLAACRTIGIEPRTIEWSDMGVRSDITQAEWIRDINLKRRNLTEDQRVMIVTEFNRRWIEEEASAAKSQGRPPTSGKELTQKSEEVPKHDSTGKNSRSTPGRIAELAETSRYKAEQAVSVSKAAERGDIPVETVEEVKLGNLPLKDAAAKVKPAASKTPEPTFEARFAKWWAQAERLFSDEELGMAVALAVSTVKCAPRSDAATRGGGR